MTTPNNMAELHVQDPWFVEIVAGRKVVEGRTGGVEKFAKCVGRTIAITNGVQTTVLRVVALRHYADLRSYLSTEGWARTAPHTGSAEEAVTAYLAVTLDNGDQVFGDERVAARGGICAIELGPLQHRFVNENNNKILSEVGPAEQKEGGPPGVRLFIASTSSESEWVITPKEAEILHQQLSTYLGAKTV